MKRNDYEALGRAAYKAGLGAAPALNPEFVVPEDLKVGARFGDMAQAYIAGWESEHQQATDEILRRETLTATTRCDGCLAEPGEPCDPFCLSRVEDDDTMITLTLRIENIYPGETVVTTRTVQAAMPHCATDEDWSDWANDYLFPVTGTGREDGDSSYDVTITKSEGGARDLEGRTFMFG